MFKKIAFSVILVFVILSIKPCFAQKENDQPPIDPTTKDYKYEDVVQVKDNVGKSELYKRAKAALSTLFNNQENTSVSQDTGEGSIVAKVYTEIQLKGLFFRNFSDVKLLYNLTLQVKQGKYRYVIDNIILKYNFVMANPRGGPDASTLVEKPLIKLKMHKLQTQANEKLLEKITALKAVMETGTSGNLKKDW